MANKTIAPNNEPEVVIEEAINQSETFIFKNGKKLITALAVIVIVVGGFFAYTQLYKLPRQEKAAAMMFVAEQAFLADSLSLALNGDGNGIAGFLKVIAEYGSTPSGNLARHYAGVCYMHMGEYETAIAQLSSYTAVDGAPAEIINAQNLGLQGDAYIQMGSTDKAISMYEKAISSSDNSLTAPYYLSKAAGLYKTTGANNKALAAYKRIRNEYINSMEAQNVEKYIGQLEQL
ncbi:MAG: tetratricopeptide repeat protein [Rikenellaceae bacterium]